MSTSDTNTFDPMTKFRQQVVFEIQAWSPMALRFSNRYLLVRQDARYRLYSPVDNGADMEERWRLDQEGSLFDDHNGIEVMPLMTLRWNGERQVDTVNHPLPALPDIMVEELRQWWCDETVQEPLAASASHDTTEEAVSPMPLCVSERRATTRTSLPKKDKP